MHVNDIWIAGGPQCGAVEMQQHIKCSNYV